MFFLGKLDVEKYQCVCSKTIITDEVIITENRIEHIIERRGKEFYECFKDYFFDIIADPDFIFKDKKENTAIVSKSFEFHGKVVNIVLRLTLEGEDPRYKNSVITAIGESEKRFAQRLRNNEPLYKKLDNDE